MKWFLVIFVLTLSWGDPAQDNIRFQIAQKFEKNGEYDQALEYYQNFLVEAPNSEQGYLALGRVYSLKGSLGQSALNYKKVLDSNPNQAEALKSLATIKEKQGMYEKSIGYLRTLADSSPKDKVNAEKQIKKLMSLKSKKGGSQASNKISSLPTKTSSSTDSKYRYDTPLFKKGLRLTNAGDDASALKVWRELLKSEPGHPGAYYYAGVNRYNLKNYKDASINFKRGYKYPEKGHNSHYYLGRIAEKQNQPQSAIKHYNNYLKKTSYAKGIQEVKGRISKLQSQPSDKSSSKVDKAAEGDSKTKEPTQPVDPKTSDKTRDQIPSKSLAKINPLNTNGFFVIHSNDDVGADELKQAWSKYRRFKVDDAMNILKKLTLDYPSSPNALAAHYNRVSINHELGLDKSVLTVAKMILRNSPPEPYKSSLYYLMAQSEFASGSKKQALEYLNQVSPDGKLGPTSAKKLSFEADLAAQLDQGADGIVKMKSAIENAKTEEKKRALMYDLARMYLDKKNIKEGVQVYRDLLAKCPKSSNLELCRLSCVGIADENFKLKNYDVALKYYQKTLEEFQDDKDLPWSQYQIGNVYVEQRKFSQAVKAYNKVSENFSDSYWASQSKWKRDDTIWRKEFEGVLSNE